MPTSAAPVASFSPLAKARPTLRPVNEPGPTVTAIRVTPAKSASASAITSAVIGARRS